MNGFKSFKGVVFLCLLCFIMISIPSFANSAEPPSITIIIFGQPDDLTLSMDRATLVKKDKLIETYYSFYFTDLNNPDEALLEVEDGDESYTIKLPVTQTYNNDYRLNLASKSISPGDNAMRDSLLIIFRVTITLLIEFIIFYFFMKCIADPKGIYWLYFFLINLGTQLLLNMWLTSLNTLSGYLFLALIIGEIFVIIFELIAFLVLLNEVKKWKTVLYVFIANITSLVLGSIYIMYLPL